jgi:hypothetical protein
METTPEPTPPNPETLFLDRVTAAVIRNLVEEDGDGRLAV